MPLHKEKYREVILSLCQKLGGEIKGKKKLAKLLYFVDFDFYEKYGMSITGDVYYARTMGPLPKALEAITRSMQKNGEIRIESVEEFGHDYAPTEIYQCAKKCIPAAHLSQKEMQMLDRVVKKYGGLNGKQLEDLTHQEAPFIATELQKEIAYELSYYRGTEFDEV